MVTNEVKKYVTELFEKGYPYRVIHYLLEKEHKPSYSFQYFQHKIIPKLGLKRRNVQMDIEKFFFLAMDEIRNGCSGCENLRQTLKLKHHLQITRALARDLVSMLDADGIIRRKGRRLRRRQYISRGPNYVWHIDGYDKLKPFNISIHGCIDGYSRKLLWLEAGPTNKRPEVVANYFISTVEDLKAFPCKIRGDPGTENGIVAKMQIAFTSDDNSFIYGSSIRNQRIERWWGWLRQSKSDFWIHHFKCLEDEGFLLTGNLIHRTCLQFAYLPLIRKELKEAMLLWNSHQIRRQKKGDTVAGVPQIMYDNPEIYDSTDHKIACEQNIIEFFKEQCQPSGLIYNEIEEDFVTVLTQLCRQEEILGECETLEDYFICLFHSAADEASVAEMPYNPLK